MTTPDWRTAVHITRQQTLDAVMSDPNGTGRATAIDFAGSNDENGKTWVGTVRMKPGSITGQHHHGRHEVAIYVIRGESEIRWGAQLEFAANVGPGDVVYFAPGVPHQERNLSATGTVEFLVVRTDNERLVFPMQGELVAAPDFIA